MRRRGQQGMTLVEVVIAMGIFAIMMTRRLMQTSETPFNSQAIGALVGAALTLAILVVVIVRLYPMIPADGALQSAPQVDPATLQSSVARLGRSFVSAEAYVLPFEVASVLLLAALVGSIVIAWPRRGEEDNQ